EPLAYARAHYLPKLTDQQRARVTFAREDVRTCRVEAEIIAAQNYSFFLFKQRAQLLAYFQAVRVSLADEGIFIMDMMGGGAVQAADVEEAPQVARPTAEDKRANPPFKYVWHEVSFDPISHDVLFHIHFRFPDGSALEKAFTYEWRLWTLPEVRE